MHSRGYERAFLENVGPIALSAAHAAPGDTLVERSPEPVRVETSEHRDRRNFVQKIRDWFRRAA